MASSVGQTFVVALFLPGIKESFTLDDAQVASLYGLATVASAAVLWGSAAGSTGWMSFITALDPACSSLSRAL
jgi:hypothetical protein